MATLNNPVEAQNIIDRFADYVVVTANADIIWGTDNKPFPEISDATFGGPRSGRAILITGAGNRGLRITARPIYDFLLGETMRYTNMKRLRAILNVTSNGSAPYNNSVGPRLTPGIIYDQTQKAHLNTTYRTTLPAGSTPVSEGNVRTGFVISRAELDSLFGRFRSLYESYRDSVETVTVNVCHANCHCSCHNSRSRR